MLLAPMCSWAEEFTVKGVTYEVLTDGTVCLVDASLVSGDYEIPMTVKSPDGSLYTVKSIGEYAFYDNKRLTSVTIPNSVNNIGFYAFAGCNALSKVVSLIEDPFHIHGWEFALYDFDLEKWYNSSATLYVPEGTADKYIDRVWHYSFSGIVEGESKVRVFTKEHVKYKVKADGSVAVSGNDSYLKGDLIIPESVTFNGITYVPTSIDSGAFSECSELLALTVSKNITNIEMDYSSLIDYYNNLTTIVVQEGNPVYDSRDNCNAIIETATNTLIQGCKNTTIPSTVTAIGGWAFRTCTDLTTIKLPDNLTSIGMGTFMETGLISVELPAGLTDLGNSYGAFECNNLVSVVSRIEEPFKLNQIVFSVWDSGAWTSYHSNATLYVPAGTIEEYKKMGWADQFAKVVEGEPGEVFKESGAVYQAQSENTVAVMVSDVTEAGYVIPETVNHDGTDYTVTAINNNAFKDNTVLAEVTIPKTVEIIGDGAFAGCSNLSAIYAYATEPAHLAATASRTRANDASSVFEGVDKENCILYVPKGCVEKYRAAEGWGEFVQIVEMEGMGISSLSPCRSVFEVYDMNGRKVRTATTSLDGLPKGIYIVNGRKVIK